ASFQTALYLADGHSGARQLVDLTGVIQGAQRFDAFGNTVAKSGPWSVGNVIGYRGERWDTTLGEYYLRARYYDPRSGRFTEIDPATSTYRNPFQAMRYGYAALNPVGIIDPTGMDGGDAVSTLGATGTIGSLVRMTVQSVFSAVRSAFSAG